MLCHLLELCWRKSKLVELYNPSTPLEELKDESIIILHTKQCYGWFWVTQKRSPSDWFEEGVSYSLEGTCIVLEWHFLVLPKRWAKDGECGYQLLNAAGEYNCFILRVFPRNEKFKSANLPPDWWSPELFLGWPALPLQKLGVSGTSTKKKKKKEKKNACAVLLVERFQMNLETLLVSGLLINAVGSPGPAAWTHVCLLCATALRNWWQWRKS